MNARRRRVYGIVNPTAALGKARRFWTKLRELLQEQIGPFPWEWTESPLQATALARSALQQGYDLIISVGGDGTHNEVINGFFTDGKVQNSQAILAVVSCGSGGDLIRSLGTTSDISSALGTFLTGSTRRVDVGHLKFTLPSGDTGERLFLNVASLGLSARVCSLLSNQPRFFGGSGRYFLATVRALMANQNERVTLDIDGNTLPSQLVNTAAIANGQFFGGGMRVAPRARLDDGMLDMVVIGPVGLLDFVRWGSRLYQGKHLNHPRIDHYKASRIHASSDMPVLVEADGETLGTLPATFTVLPQAIRILVPGH